MFLWVDDVMEHDSRNLKEWRRGREGWKEEDKQEVRQGKDLRLTEKEEEKEWEITFTKS